MNRILLAFSLMIISYFVLGQDWFEVSNTPGIGGSLGVGVEISGDGSRYIAGAPNYSSFNIGIATVYDASTGSALSTTLSRNTNNDRFASKVAMSTNGNVVAAASLNDGVAGIVRVYEWDGANYIQKGNDISMSPSSFWIRGLALNDDGNVLAYGTLLGGVKVFEYTSGSWVQVGTTITGVGYHVDLDGTGTILAIGDPDNDLVRIYDLDTDWTQFGSDIIGEASGDKFGQSVSLSSDGSILAVGANLNSGVGTNAGHVRVYERNLASYQQIGADIDGLAANELIGVSVQLNEDGTKLVVGGDNGSGRTRVYENITNVWTQVGADISGPLNSKSGQSVSISSDGYTIAIGAPTYNSNNGLVTIMNYRYEVSETYVLCPGESFSFGTQTITTAGAYQELLTSSDGLDSLVDLTVSVSDLAITIDAISDNTCNGGLDGSITIGASGGLPSYQYRLAGETFDSNNVISGLAAGSYTVELMDARGCIVSTSATVSEPVGLSLSSTVVDVSCFGQADGQITLSATGGTAPYEYSIDGSTYSGTASFASLSGGTYTMYVRDGNGCIFTDNVTIDEPLVMTPSVSNATAVYGGVTNAGLVISPDPTDTYVTHYQITNITGGTLFKSDGSTKILESNFITTVEGAAGLVFEPSQAGTTTFDIQASFNGTCLGGSIVTASIVVAKATLECTVSASIVYGEAIPAFSIQYGGFVSGEDESVLDVPSTATTSAQQFDDVGNYTITITAGSDDNYSIFAIDGTLSVTQAPLVVTANDKSISYGEALPTFDGTLSGIINNDNINATYTCSADGSVTGAFDIIASISDPDGQLSNYAVTNNSGTLSVNPVPLVVTVNDKSIVYGESLPTYDGMISGLVNNDNLSATYSSVAVGTTAGTFSINASINDPEGKLSNYTVTNNPGSLTINAAPLNVVANDKSTVYGDALPTFDGTVSGVVNNDDITATYSSGADGTEAGTFTIAATLNDPNGKLSNYTVTNVDGSLLINKAVLQVAVDDVTITENDNLPTFTLSYSGFVNSDDPSVLDTAPTATTSAMVGVPGTYQIVASGGADNNYDFTYTEGTLTIEDVLGFGDDVSWSVFPNPTSSIIFIKGEGVRKVVVSNLHGQELMNVNDTTIDLSNFANGIYIISLRDVEGKELATGRVIKR